MENSVTDQQLVGVWIADQSITQINADGTIVIDGQWFRYTADGHTFTIIGTRGTVQVPYHLDGDTLTYVANGQRTAARRLSQETISHITQAMKRGAGVWVGSETSLDPSLFINWTQYLALYPDGSVDYAQSDTSTSQQQVTDYSARFFYSHEASGSRQSVGLWQSDGMNVMVQWNNGSAWRGQADVANGKLIFLGIGRLNEGSNVLFERQSPAFNFAIPSGERKDATPNA
jgi:hypothetical protein